MDKAQLLYVDDEMLFIRTVQRILRYSKFHDKLEITAAYHPLDALEWINKKTFDAIMVDFRLEPDKSPVDECNGEKLVKSLKERNPDCLYYLLSATEGAQKEDLFTKEVDKSCDSLNEVICDIFEDICKNIEVKRLNTYKAQENSKFRGDNGDNGDCCKFRQTINLCIKNKENIVLVQKDEGNNKLALLLEDIQNEDQSIFKDVNNCSNIKRIDLLLYPNTSLENSLSSEVNIVIFVRYNEYNDNSKKIITQWMNTHPQSIVFFTFSDTGSIPQNFHLVCECEGISLYKK